MKKLIFGIAALFMMSVVLVGCDDKKSKKDKDDEDEDERTEEVADIDDEDEDNDDEEDTASFSLAPEEKVLDLFEDAVSIMKRTHIRNQDDVLDFADKMKPIQNGVEKAMEEMMEAYKDKSAEEMEEIGIRFEAKAKELGEEAERQGERLKKEAEEAGVDLSEIEDLDLF